jgi:hypothetical protein
MYEACRPADSQDGFPPYYDQSDGVQQFNIIDGAGLMKRGRYWCYGCWMKATPLHASDT